MTAAQQFPVFADALRSGFAAPLNDLGLMAFSGADAVSFLHRQLTNDVEHLRPTEARLAGYCTPQGRLLATLLVWKDRDRLLLQLPLELLDGMQKRLRLFVLRDKVAIADATPDFAQIGLGGTAAAAALTPWFDSLPTEPHAKIDGEHGSLIRVADAFGAPRYLWIVPAAAIGQVWPSLNGSLKPLAADAWRLAEIDAGIPRIMAATQEKFVAQMVNFELVGGVSFKKGCYPGQEIVARTQYRGQLRRRMLAATIELTDAPVAAGTDVYADDDPSQPIGTIVNAERSANEEIRCLVSLRLPVQEGVQVHLGTTAGPTLHFVPLPYELPAENG